ncbi:MAG: MarR family transcriptional regulator [Comamonadaceae bacterium]|nr:MAG: MarR family transcriptional regulator [Comamonadaceae bacterium]
MNAPALQSCLLRQHAHAALTFRLDEELGTHHGLAWSDFVLLALVDEAGGALATPELATRLGLRRSHFVLQVLPLEKTGLVARTIADDGSRQVALRPAGRRLLREARETAEFVCASAEGVAPSPSGRGLG